MTYTRCLANSNEVKSTEQLLRAGHGGFKEDTLTGLEQELEVSEGH